MPKFLVTVAKDGWQRAVIEVEAASATEAEANALAQAERDETTEWQWEELRAYDVIEVENAVLHHS